MVCQAQQNGEKSVEPMMYEDLQAQLNQAPGLKVVNFWATWCRPCLQEMPHFEEVYQEYKEKGLQMIFVSLDDPGKTEMLRKFVEKKGIKGQVVHIQNTDPNAWTDQVNKSWSGALPSTVFINEKGESVDFHQGKLSREELEVMVQRYLPKN
jgi:thiol-disulfide isomerase/thioredoxin